MPGIRIRTRLSPPDTYDEATHRYSDETLSQLRESFEFMRPNKGDFMYLENDKYKGDCVAFKANEIFILLTDTRFMI